MSWKPEIAVIEDGKKSFYQNGQTFATFEEARKSALNREWNWTMAVDSRAVEVDSAEFPVNYRWDEVKGDVRLEVKND